jgi:uncharacterized membrane protein YhhN
MFWVFMGLFAGAGAAHLVFLFLGKEGPGNITKMFLVPLLAGAYVFGAKSISLPVLLALVFGWGGDLFLLKMNDLKFFRLGLGSFLAGHLCYIIAFVSLTGIPHIIVLVVSIAAAIPLTFLVHSVIKPNKEMNLPVVVYEIVIMLMSLSALQLMLSRRDGCGLLAFAGSLCFLFSDTLLAYSTFRTGPKHASFFVMLSYIAAQAAIAGGLMGIAGP